MHYGTLVGRGANHIFSISYLSANKHGVQQVVQLALKVHQKQSQKA